MTDAERLPPLNQRVTLLLPACGARPHPTRVEDTGGGTVTVAAPARHDAAPCAAPGKQLLCCSQADDGRLRRPVQLAATVRGHVPAWQLVPTGPGVRLQDRSSFRVTQSGVVEVVTGGVTRRAALADLSEGGVR
jgi:hypothetical protein